MECSKEKFIEMYNTMRVKDVAKALNVKENQVIKCAKQLGISKPRGVKSKNSLILTDVVHEVKSVVAQQFFDYSSKQLFNCPEVEWTEENLMNLPRINGVYVIYHSSGKILYVGESKNIYDRIYNHHRPGNASELTNKMRLHFEFKTDEELSQYLSECYIKYVELAYGRSELEEYLIDKYTPLFNNFKIKLRKGLTKTN